ncbi:hypothetical protein HHK36_001830 [Tetracentron sinense]|uniref:MACPF domain-containing protein n=1 Tax=Tetracentron sinense TaxID=13715 RepID=A0A835DRY7_TETSI|nr:hypothetical protein HHK36_001830 [Tetracentron sinense]
MPGHPSPSQKSAPDCCSPCAVKGGPMKPTRDRQRALIWFIEKYGTHIIVGVKMGGKDVIHIKQLQNSNLQPTEVQKLLKQLGDERFSEDVNGNFMLNSDELSGKLKRDQFMAWGIHAALAKSIRLPLVSHSKKDEIVSVLVRRGGIDNGQSHNQWLSTISQSPNVVSMSFLPITSLLSGVRGGGFLSHAVNLYLRYKPPIEELHQFLQFQLPRQWAPVYSYLPLGPQHKKHDSPSLQFTFLGSRLYVNTLQMILRRYLVWSVAEMKRGKTEPWKEGLYKDQIQSSEAKRQTQTLGCRLQMSLRFLGLGEGRQRWETIEDMVWDVRQGKLDPVFTWATDAMVEWIQLWNAVGSEYGSSSTGVIQEDNSFTCSIKLLVPFWFLNPPFQVDSGNHPVTGIRLFLEGKKSDHLAVHLQHLSTLPKNLQLSDDYSYEPNDDPLVRGYFEPVKWTIFSHVYTAPVQHNGACIDESASIVTKAWFEVRVVGMRKVLFLRLGFSRVASSRIRRSEWDGPPISSRKSGAISMLISTRFSTGLTQIEKPGKVDLNSAVFPGGPPVSTRLPKMSNFVDAKEMIRGPEDLPGYWVVTGAKLCVEGGKISLKVKYSLLTIMYCHDLIRSCRIRAWDETRGVHCEVEMKAVMEVREVFPLQSDGCLDCNGIVNANR